MRGKGAAEGKTMLDLILYCSGSALVTDYWKSIDLPREREKSKQR